MNWVNLTPHDITLLLPYTEPRVIKRSGDIARVSVTQDTIEFVEDIPIKKQHYSVVQGLPEPVEGVGYIVSSLIAQACPDRKDLYFPVDLVRDNNGKVVGSRALGVL